MLEINIKYLYMLENYILKNYYLEINIKKILLKNYYLEIIY